MRFILSLSLLSFPFVGLAQTVVTQPVVPPLAAPAPAALPRKAPTYPLNQLLNLFMAQLAYSRVEWQRDIRLEGSKERAMEVASTSPGRYVSQSTYFGYYTYVPASYQDLTKIQKESLLTSPQLKAWLEWFGTKTRIVPLVDSKPPVYTPTAPVGPTDLAPDFGRYSYTISVDEMLSTQPLHLKLRE